MTDGDGTIAVGNLIDTSDTPLDCEQDKQCLIKDTSNYSQEITRPPLCGFLTLHSKTGLMKSYKTKWFVYSDNVGKLLYYKSKGELRPEGEIFITHATFSFDVKDKPGVFEIRVGEIVTVLEAADREEMFTWLQELQTRRKDITKKLSRPGILKVSNASKDTSAESNGDTNTVLDEHPHIVLREDQKHLCDKPTVSHSINKLSHNVSKAAGSAKQRLSAMFNRKSTADEISTCDSCLALSQDLYEAEEEARVAKVELSANQAVLKMLNDQTNLLTQQNMSLKASMEVYKDPNLANQVDQEHEIRKLKLKVDELNQICERLKLDNKSLECEVSDLKERQEMCTETISAKDSVIVALSQKLEACTSIPSPTTPHIDYATVEPFHESVKDKLEAYELQNKFLNKEILELHSVRLEDEKRMQELHTKNMELEAIFYQLQSKYLLVLNEMNKPQLDETGDTKPVDELMGRLLDEAINQEQTGGVELRDSLNSSHRAAKKYDSYGFEIEEWSDDIASKAAGLQRMSENVLASMFESPEAVSLRVKWENYLAVVSSQDIQRSVEFKNLIRAGIPKDHREKVWNILINFHVKKFRASVGTGYYTRLVQKHSRSKHNPVAKQIELDLRRTLPNNRHFEADDSEGIPKLRRMLLAYSYHNPTVGYCQGMNRVAAFALLFLQEEDAFWCLVAIIDFIMPPDYFSPSMVAAQADQRVLREILSEKLPKVTAHLESLEIDISLFSFNWFLTLFIESIPTCTVLRIWDSFLCEGIKILFRYATAFFKFNEEGILNTRDFLSANQHLREMAANMVDVEKLTDIAFKEINPFPIRAINVKRAMYLQQVKAELKELNALRSEFKSQRPDIEFESEDDIEEGDDFQDHAEMITL